LRVLYIDEAGCLGKLPSAISDIQPVFTFIGLTFAIDQISNLTRDFLALKRRFFPGIHRSQHSLDDILAEIKGADIGATLPLEVVVRSVLLSDFWTTCSL